jgi:hypothetical protein
MPSAGSVEALVQLAMLAAIVLFLIGLVFLGALVLVIGIVMWGKRLVTFVYQRHMISVQFYRESWGIDVMRFDTVLNQDSIRMFVGNSDDAVAWLEKVTSVYKEPLWVSVGETGDLITASQYLDLAS